MDRTRLEITRTICLLTSLPASPLISLRVARLSNLLNSLDVSIAADPFERVLADVAEVGCDLLRC